MRPTRAELQEARDYWALEALFFWQAADRAEREGSSPAKWRRKADDAAARALNLNAHLERTP